MESHRIDLTTLVADLVSAHPALPSESLSNYLSEIVNWNDRVPLVSRRSTGMVLHRLVRQSVALWEAVVSIAAETRPASFVDIGSGAGFPGVVWALTATDLRGLLIERRQRKATFLEHVVRALGLAGLEVYVGDARDAALREAWTGAFDVSTTMAVSEPATTIPLARPFLAPGGAFATVAGSSTRAPDVVDELKRVHRSTGRDGTIVVYRAPD